MFDFKNLVEEAIKEAKEFEEKEELVCQHKKFLWIKYTTTHNWEKWSRSGQTTDNFGSITKIIMGRTCKKCGVPQFKDIPFGNI